MLALDSHYPITLRAKRRCFRGLVKLCGEHGILPSSYLLPESKIQKLEDEGPRFTGGFSDIWPGVYEDETFVAIKVIRCCETDVQKTKKVGYHYIASCNIEPDCLQNFCREVITWKRLSHPNILELIGVTMNDRECTMVSPWMECGNIMSYLRENRDVNPLELVRTAPYPGPTSLSPVTAG